MCAAGRALLGKICSEKFCLERSVLSRERVLLTLEEVEDQRGVLSYPLFHGGVCGL